MITNVWLFAHECVLFSFWLTSTRAGGWSCSNHVSMTITNIAMRYVRDIHGLLDNTEWFWWPLTFILVSPSGQMVHRAFLKSVWHTPMFVYYECLILELCCSLNVKLTPTPVWNFKHTFSLPMRVGPHLASHFLKHFSARLLSAARRFTLTQPNIHTCCPALLATGSCPV